METSKKIVERDQEVIFTNWTDQDFSHTYDQGRFSDDGNKKRWITRKRLYTLKAGKSYYLPFYLAELFAKHLTDREYNKAFNQKLTEVKIKSGGLITDRRVLEHQAQVLLGGLSRQEMMNKCVEFLSEDESEVEVVKPQEMKLREVVLNRDERGKALAEKYGLSMSSAAGGGNVQVNVKALEEQEQSEEFEEEIK